MLYLSAIVLSFFLAFVLFTKKQKTTADNILLAWLTVIGLHLLNFYLFISGGHYDLPLLVVLSFPLPLTHGPFLFLYTINQTTGSPFRKKQLLHFIPVILSYMLFARFYFLSQEEQLQIIGEEGRSFKTELLINIIAIYISGVAYTTLSLIRLLSYRKRLRHQFSNTEKINFNWLLYLVAWVVLIWLIVIFVQQDEFIFGAVAIFVGWLGYFGIKQVQVFSQENRKLRTENDRESEPDNYDPLRPIAPKYQRSTLSEEAADLVHMRLTQLMQEQQPFKNPDLTLNDLAKTLDIHPNYLSQVINSKEDKNFYDLINEKRVQEFIRLSAQPDNGQFTLLSLAYDCGFNSKASFNRNFKKYTGVTPTIYLRQRSALA